jgi:autotransporter-associated beta strand protein
MVNNGGVIEILADNVQNSGSITANAKGNTGNGGQINIKANTIALADTSKIKANAKEQGNGGQIIVLSEKKTQVSGVLEAKGGKTSGNGGFIDTSSKEVLEISRSTKVDTSARNILGKAGTWLLDPMDLLITSSFAQVISDALQNNNVTVQVQGNVCSGGSCTQNGSGNLTIDRGVTITKTGSLKTVLTFLADGTFFNYGTINQAADSILEIVIQAQNVNLAQNSKIEVNKVTITAVNSVTGYGNIIGTGANPLVNILANVFNFHGAITVNGNISNNQTPGTIRITAQDLTLPSTGRLEANSSTDGGTIVLKANTTGTINIEGVIQTNGGNGRGGEINISDAHDIIISNNAIIKSNADNGGSIQIFTNSGDLILQNALIQTNGSNGRGGSINLNSDYDLIIGNADIQASGNNGGDIQIKSTSNKVEFDNSVIQTNGGSGRGGTVNISANSDNLIINGAIEVKGTTLGGGVILTATHIQLNNQANINATGNLGGGYVLVGGDWQGGANVERRIFSDPNSLYQATTVTMHQDALIDASATTNGNGGTVVLWSDIKNPASITNVNGAIIARGGAIQGRGGNVETSAGLLNTEHIFVDTRAADGSAGNWLLDPWNYVIGTNGASDIATYLATTNVLISTSAATSIRLDGSGNCTGCGDMVIQGAITYTGANARRLTFKADSYISLTASITSTNAALDVILWTDAGATGGIGNGGYLYMAPGTSISTNGGKIVLAGGADTNSDGIPDGYAWNSKSAGQAGVMLGDAGGLGSSVNLVSNGGDIIIRGKTSGSSAYPGMLTQKTFKIDSGTGTILIDATSSTGHGFEWVYGVAADFSITSASTSSTAISITGTTSVAGYTGALIALRTGSYLIQSTASTGGGIQIYGQNTAATGNQVYLSGTAGYAYILSKNGPINISGSGANLGITSGGVITFGASSGVTINGVTSSVATSGSNITLESSNFYLGVAYASTSGNISFNGPIVLLGDQFISSTAGVIRYASTINSDASSTPRAMTVNAGTGSILFDGNIGSTYALSNLNASGSAGITINGNITTVTGLADGLLFEAFDGYIGSNLSSFNTAARQNIKTTDISGAPGNTDNITRTSISVCTSSGCDDTYSYRVTGYFVPKESGTHTFQGQGDDPWWVFIGSANQKISDFITQLQANTSVSSSTSGYVVGNASCCVDTTGSRASLVAGTAYPIYAMFSENAGGDFLSVAFKSPSSGANFVGESTRGANAGTTKLSDGYGYYFNGTINTGVTLTGPVTLKNSVTINAQNATVQINGSVTDAGASKNLTITNGSSYLANTNITGSVTANQFSLSTRNSSLGGDLNLSSSASIEVTGAPTNTSSLFTSSVGAASITGGIKGSGVTLTKTGAGVLTLSGANTYTGATTISAGSLNVSGSLSDSSAITVASGATYNVDVTDTVGSIAGAGTINKLIWLEGALCRK